MLNLGGPAVVRGNGCPTIVENDDPVIALGEDGLDGEGHTRQHDLFVPSVGHVVHVRRAVKVGPDPVASEATDHREAVLPGVLVDGLADGAERDTGATHVEADGQALLGRLDQPLAGLVNVTYHECLGTVTVEPVLQNDFMFKRPKRLQLSFM